MRKILFAIAVSVLLAGCGTFTKVGTIPVDPTLPAPAQAVQTGIHESNVLIAASAVVLLENYNGGIVTASDFIAERGQLRSYANQLDRAQTLLDDCVKVLRNPATPGDPRSPRPPPCDFTEPQRQAEITAGLVTALHKKIADRRRELK